MTAASIRRRIAKGVRIGRLLPGVARSLPPGTFRQRLLDPVAAKIRNGARFALVRQTRIVDMLLGRRAGNAFFWRSPMIPKSWDHVERRLIVLGARDPAAIDDFVRRALAHSDDFVVLTNLARSSPTRAAMAGFLAGIDLGEGSAMARRLGSSHALAAALVGAATLLLPPAEAERLAARVRALLPGLTEGYFALLDSLGARLAAPPVSVMQRGLPASGLRSGCRHRLIIAGSLRDKKTISLLFAGAERVTLYAMNDLYGRAEFAQGDALHGLPDTVSVEHARSRITRFSADYHRLHAETRAIAERAVARLDAAQAGRRVLAPEARPFAELALADTLFFPSLMLAAVRKLLEDPDFDHIVIALLGRQADGDLTGLLSGIEELRQDGRVEVVCLSRSLGDRGAFPAQLAQILGGPARAAAPRHWGPPLDVAAEGFDAACAATMPRLPAWAGDGRPRVLMVSAPSRAYDMSSAAYRAALGRHFDTQTAVIGKSAAPLLIAGAAQEPAAGGIFAIPTEMNRRSERPFLPLRLWLDGLMQEVAAEFAGTLSGHLLGLRRDQMVRNGLLSFLVFFGRAVRWFDAMAAAGTLPGIVILCPYRDPQVAAMTAIARVRGVPTFAVEPHGLNATYCRYNRIHADHYGVITTFFRDEAAADFGIPRDRCHVIGSPRLSAPAEYDLDRRTAEARNEAAQAHGLAFPEGVPQFAFFSQPSTWDQMAGVWRILLEASAGTGATILLKTHPEEGPSRVADYLAIAEELRAGGRVQLWPGTAREAIECADLVLSAYSATVVEAATLRRPVICIANGDIDYPLDQHRVIGAPLVRDAATLAEALRAFIADPEPMRARAAGFLQREHHLVEGIEVGLARAVDGILAMPPEMALRSPRDLPESAFLKGPHRVYAV